MIMKSFAMTLGLCVFLRPAFAADTTYTSVLVPLPAGGYDFARANGIAGNLVVFTAAKPVADGRATNAFLYNISDQSLTDLGTLSDDRVIPTLNVDYDPILYWFPAQAYGISNVGRNPYISYSKLPAMKISPYDYAMRLYFRIGKSDYEVTPKDQTSRIDQYSFDGRRGFGAIADKPQAGFIADVRGLGRNDLKVYGYHISAWEVASTKQFLDIPNPADSQRSYAVGAVGLITTSIIGNYSNTVASDKTNDTSFHAARWELKGGEAKYTRTDLAQVKGKNGIARFTDGINIYGSADGRPAVWYSNAAPANFGCGSDLAPTALGYGLILGYASNAADDLFQDAVYWTDLKSCSVNLNDVSDHEKNWHFTSGVGVNSGGAILVNGYVDVVQDQRVFVLTPKAK
jgi:hypothetical protein